ncbi:2OG-Fe(II) oxygenase [Synechococcus sp. A15-28]|uniref:2OG-Fe(II) oxygenase n=1 Tax=Synechococcus sp. A15-28 TaxID=1050638 RepID=UPI001860A700|nr:2OG-Fe(II) oxygenase [Synechococcus sp. A15-28]QNI41235.1 2OG-Fe(II) oxygenase superfamily protein [Synechococcus sp. A15-28]
MAIHASELAHTYAANNPFPHLVLRNSWDEALLSRVAAECDAFTNWDEEKSFYGSIGKRTCGTFSKLPKYTAKLVSYCNGSKFLAWLEELTGESGLISDPHLFGGGIHSTINQGFLKMHTDFNWHHRLKLYRRLNLLIYLNKNWQKLWGGELLLARMTEAGLHTEASIAPCFNTMVIFTTTDHSFHGHPQPMLLPEGRARNSIALYYYVSEKPKGTSDIRRTMTDYRRSNGQRYL